MLNTEVSVTFCLEIAYRPVQLHTITVYKLGDELVMLYEKNITVL